MDDRRPLTDEMLEAELRSLPELDAPPNLVSRVMAQVEGEDMAMGSSLGAPSPSPRHSGSGTGSGIGSGTGSATGSGTALDPASDPGSDPGSDSASGVAPVPDSDGRGRGAGAVPAWQPLAAVTVLAAVIVFVALRNIGASVELVRGGMDLAFQTVRFAAEASIRMMVTGGSWFGKAAFMASVFGNVVRTVAAVVVGEFAPYITAAVAVAIGLQLLLLGITGRRSELS